MAKKPTKKTISLHDIRIDGGTQPRVELDMGHVKDLTAVLDDGGDFKDPIVVFNDGSNLWLADGHHRYQAYTACDIVEVPAEVHNGTQRDAVLYSCGANAAHGLRRCNADKRQAVEKLLSDSEWCKWSDREIARRCGVDHSYVGKLRKEFTGDNTSERTYTNRHGQQATMDTSKIGRREVPPPPADSPDAPGDPLDAIGSYDDLGDEPEHDEDDNAGKAAGPPDPRVMNMPVHPALKAANDEAAVLRRCQADIQQIRSAVKATDGQPIGAFLNHQDIDLHLKNAWAGIKFGLPRHVCPACNGEGCKVCRSGGWLPKVHFERYEAAQKKG